MAGATACARHPLVVTEPARVVIEHGTTHAVAHESPRRAVQWYDDFWRAVINLNLPVAWAIAGSREELLTSIGRLPVHPAIVPSLHLGAAVFDDLPVMIVDTGRGT